MVRMSRSVTQIKSASDAGTYNDAGPCGGGHRPFSRPGPTTLSLIFQQSFQVLFAENKEVIQQLTHGASRYGHEAAKATISIGIEFLAGTGHEPPGTTDPRP